jgi:hypothetical protein
LIRATGSRPAGLHRCPEGADEPIEFLFDVLAAGSVVVDFLPQALELLQFRVLVERRFVLRIFHDCS